MAWKSGLKQVAGYNKKIFTSVGTPDEAVAKAKQAGFSVYAKRNVPFGNWGGWVIYARKKVK